MNLITDLFSFAYVPSWYTQLDELAELAIPEPWCFRSPNYYTKNQDTPILERYIHCIVLDPFLGSGSTLIVCEQTKRICYGIELDEKFVDVIVKRYLEQRGLAEDVSVIRDGQEIKYGDLNKPVKTQN